MADKGAKTPRTLFSLGRPGSSSSEAPVEEAPVEEAPVEEAPVEEYEEGLLLCGACEAPLPIGASQCASCGTPVAFDEEELEFFDDEPELADVTEDEAISPDELDEREDEPAAVLYADPDVAEPLPDAPAGSFDVAAPVVGSLADDEPAFEFDEEVLPAEPEPMDTEPVADTDTEPVADTDTEPVADTDTEPVADTDTAPVAEGEPDESGHEMPVAGAALAAGVVADELVHPEVAHAETLAPGAETSQAVVPGQEVSPGYVEATPTVPQPAYAAATVQGGRASAGPPVGGSPTDGEGKSKAGLWIGVAAAAVIVLLIGGLVLANAGKKDDKNVQTAQTASTTAASAPGPSSGSQAASSSAAPTTVATLAPSSSAATTALTIAPTTGITFTAPTVSRPPQTLATTTLAAGRISADPASGTPGVTVNFGQSFSILLTNQGSQPAQCKLSVPGGGLTISPTCEPSIPAGGIVTVTVTGTVEGTHVLSGAMEGVGLYTLSVFVKNA